MSVKSKQSLILYFLVALLMFFSGLLFLVAWVIIKTNIENIFRLDIISGTLFMIWFGLFPLILVGQHLRGIRINETHLELSYFFGLLRFRHEFKDLKQSQYRYYGEGVVIETNNGHQITLGQRQYRNYTELRNMIDEKITKSDELTVRRVNRTIIIQIISGAIILTSLIISLNL